ncbi:DUF6452 family protein [Flavobacterium sp. UBA7682]|uniref:DUF6452 family protein n=1 Tax=Flavobacterium sp. UBA7682 TaxID=1946560 RepID=UPI0025BB2B43|nr:DUF6452 family protein [Flavobacterium sp. UBA7682]
MKKILALLLLAISFSGCEKDDICVDETTPRLIIEFYDDANPANLKNVTNLEVTEVGRADSLKIFSGVSVIELPLKNTADMTKYSLVLNSTSTIPGLPNDDYLEFNYTRENVFVSRACGYKTIFKLNNSNGFIPTDSEALDSPWILNHSIQTSNIETENDVHIKIYF